MCEDIDLAKKNNITRDVRFFFLLIFLRLVARNAYINHRLQKIKEKQTQLLTKFTTCNRGPADARDFFRVGGHHSVLEIDEKWCGTLCYKPYGECDRTSEAMILEIAESDHTVFRCSSSLST